MVSLLTPTCVTRSQWVKDLSVNPPNRYILNIHYHTTVHLRIQVTEFKMLISTAHISYHILLAIYRARARFPERSSTACSVNIETEMSFRWNFFTGCTESCQNDNFRYPQWPKCRHNNDISVSVELHIAQQRHDYIIWSIHELYLKRNTGAFNSSPLDKMAVISQTTFSDAF